MHILRGAILCLASSMSAVVFFLGFLKIEYGNTALEKR